MAFTSSTRLVNPRLGTYFGIFTAALVALVLMALMLEQLGVADGLLRALMFAAPLLLYAAIGFNARAREPHDYFASGRRVPAFFNGLVLGVAAHLVGEVHQFAVDAVADQAVDPSRRP